MGELNLLRSEVHIYGGSRKTPPGNWGGAVPRRDERLPIRVRKMGERKAQPEGDTNDAVNLAGGEQGELKEG